ncbi:MAG: hypothetical protein V7672_02395 [Brevundimonas sp.]|jgi:hypothetical protein|uniref:DUF7660 family protein n=1 Tax=Brevundimonas sp. TaxID=1871086 RepID=UPI003003947D
MFGRGKPNEYDGDSLALRAGAIETREDFVRFAQLLTQNYRKRRGEWENDKLDRYLEAVAGFSSDFDGHVRNTGSNVEENPWRLLASVLLAAKVYE